MTGIRLTVAQARRLGITGGSPTGDNKGMAPSKPGRATKKQLPRDGQTSTCHTCGAVFTSDAAETRHVNDTLHPRYLSELEVVS